MTEQRALNTSPLPLRLRVDDFLLLDRAGAFDGYGKTELLGGEIFYMNAQHRPHSRVKTRLAFALGDALQRIGSALSVLIEPTIAMPPHDAPEPDIVLTSEPDGDGPVPLASVRLVIEVADATLAGDLERKQALYAAHDVPEYWVVDINGRNITQLWSPAGTSYADQRRILFGDPVDAVRISGLTVPTVTL